MRMGERQKGGGNGVGPYERERERGRGNKVGLLQKRKGERERRGMRWDYRWERERGTKFRKNRSNISDILVMGDR